MPGSVAPETDERRLLLAHVASTSETNFRLMVAAVEGWPASPWLRLWQPGG